MTDRNHDASPDEVTQNLFAPTARHAHAFGHRKERPDWTLPMRKASPQAAASEATNWTERFGIPAFFSARSEAQKIFESTGTKPRLFSGANFSAFANDVSYAFRLMLQEKEIILFAALQWAVIALAYLLWTQILDWIPDSVWAEVQQALEEDRDAQADLANLALWGWSLFVVVLAAYPLALLNASITAAHCLRASGHRSTIGACLTLASKNLGRLWLFMAVDGFITVMAILDRLPKKRGKRTAREEATYYAWKIGTAGMLPALVAGRGFVDAAKDSVTLLEKEPVRAIGIRMSYSLLCWIVGILAYAGAMLYFMRFGGHIGGPNWVYDVYFLMAAPICIAVGVTSLLLRPLFVIAMAKLYTDVIPANPQTVDSGMIGLENFDLKATAIAMILGILLALFFFG